MIRPFRKIIYCIDGPSGVGGEAGPGGSMGGGGGDSGGGDSGDHDDAGIEGWGGTGTPGSQPGDYGYEARMGPAGTPSNSVGIDGVGTRSGSGPVDMSNISMNMPSPTDTLAEAEAKHEALVSSIRDTNAKKVGATIAAILGPALGLVAYGLVRTGYSVDDVMTNNKIDKAMAEMGLSVDDVTSQISTAIDSDEELTAMRGQIAGGDSGGMDNSSDESNSGWLDTFSDQNPPEGAQDTNLPQYDPVAPPDFAGIEAKLTQITDDLSLATQLRDLSQVTGALSDEENSMLDQLEENSRLTLSELVNSETEDVLKTSIASMVDRGVLQGGVGSETLKRIDDLRTTRLTQGYRDISSQRIGQELTMREANKDRQMDLWDLEQSGAIAKAGIQQENVKTEADLAWKDYTAETQQKQFEYGEQMDWQKALLTSETNKYYADKGLTIAGMEQESAERANKYDMWGNIIGGVSTGVAKWLSNP